MTALNQATSQLVLTPAYGKTYVTKEDMLTAWKAGKDFKILNGNYCSIRDESLLKANASSVVLTKDYFEYIVV